MSDDVGELEPELEPEERFHLFAIKPLFMPGNIDKTEFYPTLHGRRDYGNSKEVSVKDALRMILSMKSDDFDDIRDFIISTLRLPKKDPANPDLFKQKVQEWNEAFAVALSLAKDSKRMFINVNLIKLFDGMRYVRKPVFMSDFMKIYAPILSPSYPANICRELDNFQTSIQHNGNAVPVWLLIAFYKIKLLNPKSLASLRAVSPDQWTDVIRSFGTRYEMSSGECNFIGFLLNFEYSLDRVRDNNSELIPPVLAPLVNNFNSHYQDRDAASIIPELVEAFENWKSEYTFKLKQIKTITLSEDEIQTIIKFARVMPTQLSVFDWACTKRLTFDEVYKATLEVYPPPLPIPGSGASSRRPSMDLGEE